MSELRVIKRGEINEDLWNNQVLKYGDGRPYSYTWYLDALGKWKGLIVGDYNIILPLPYHQKYVYQKRLYQPFLSQLFGPLGMDMSHDYTTEILNNVKTQWPNSQLFLPQGIRGIDERLNVTNRVNQIIPLNREIEEIRSEYTKARRAQIRQNKEKVKITFDTDIERFLQAYKSAEFPKEKPILKQWSLFNRVLAACNEVGFLEIIRVEDLQGGLLTTAAFIITNTRVINLIGVSSALSRDYHGNAIKIDAMLARYCTDKQMFDFFGSNLPGVNGFNKQFGADEELYIQVET